MSCSEAPPPLPVEEAPPLPMEDGPQLYFAEAPALVKKEEEEQGGAAGPGPSATAVKKEEEGAAGPSPSPADALADGPPADQQLWPEEKPGSSGPTEAEQEAILKAFFDDVKEVDRDNEVNRILGAFKLNPFEQLGLRFDATKEEAKRQYRKVSLLVHPDKTKHPLATSAFEVVGAANKALQEEENLHELRFCLNQAREEVRKERRKAVRNDASVRLASVIHKEGRAGVEAEYEQSPEFHELWKLKSRDMLARAEWRRRKITKRLKDEAERIEEGEADTRKKIKAERDYSKKWEDTRDTRVGTWRNFVTKKTKSKKSSVALMGGIKPPKYKEEDEEHTYISRPVGEQHRPPPSKAAGPQDAPPPPKMQWPKK